MQRSKLRATNVVLTRQRSDRSHQGPNGSGWVKTGVGGNFEQAHTICRTLSAYSASKLPVGEISATAAAQLALRPFQHVEFVENVCARPLALLPAWLGRLASLSQQRLASGGEAVLLQTAVGLAGNGHLDESVFDQLSDNLM